MTRLTIGAVAALLLAATSAALLQSRSHSSTKALTLPTTETLPTSRSTTSTYRKRMRTTADELTKSLDALEATLVDTSEAGRAKSKKALADLRQRMTSLQDVMSQYMPDLGDLTDTERLKEAASHGYTRLESAAQDMRESLAGLGDYVTDTTNSSLIGASQAVHKAYDEALESSDRFSDLLVRAKDAGTAKAKEGAQVSREALTAAYDEATRRFDTLSQTLSEQAAGGTYAIKEGATHAADQAREGANQAADKAARMASDAKDAVRDKTAETASNVADAASGAAGAVVNKTKEGASAATSSAARLAAAAREKAYRAYSAAYEELHDAWSKHGVLHEAASDVGDTANSAADYAHQAFDKASARLKDVAQRARAHLAPHADETAYDEATQHLHDQLDATKEAMTRVMGTNEPALTDKAKKQLDSAFESMIQALARVKDGDTKQRMRDELAAAYDDVMQTLLVHPPPGRLERLKANLRHML